MIRHVLSFFTAGAVAAGALVVACSSSSAGKTFTANSTEYTSPDGTTGALESPGSCSGATGGSVVGPQDDHCEMPDGGQIVQNVTAAGCTSMVAPPGDDGGDDGGDVDSGDPCPGDMGAYGAVMYNNWGSDDDCKYDVSWQSTPICEGQPVYFTVLVTLRADGSPLGGSTMAAAGSPLLGVETGGTFVPANPRPDVVQACDHPIPNTPMPRDPSVAVGPGTYVVGPIVFDRSGQWVFRFHFNEECFDIADDSPHGHAAFFINVP